MAGDGVRGGLGVRQGAVDEALEGVQLRLELVQAVGGELQGDIRDHLAHDAAHVLAALDGAPVVAGGQIPILPAGDAAHVVAHVGIAHGAPVGAALDDAGGEARDAAGIRGDGGLGDLLPLEEAVEGTLQLLQLGGGDVLLGDGGIHGGPILTAEEGPGVLPGDAAGILGPPDDAGDAAVLDGALVVPGDAAHGGAAHHHAGEGAVFDAAGVLPGDAAHAALLAGGGDLRLHGEISHGGAGLDPAEKAVGGVALREPEAGDAVALAVEGPQEEGDGDGGALGVDVRRQADGEAVGVAVGGAVFGEGREVF